MRGVEATATAAGRVTVVGEHTDYNEGRSLAVATEQRTTVHVRSGAPGAVEVRSALGTAVSPLDRPAGPPFAVVAATLAKLAGIDGARMEVRSDLPVGAGLSSSAAYAVAVALAVGLRGDPVAVASACQAAERAAGSDVGLLDQLVSLCAREGAAVAIEFGALHVETVALPDAIGLSAVDTGERRAVGTSPYADRRAQCAAAAARIGPLGRASLDDVAGLTDPVLRARARHVVTECARVLAARACLEARDLRGLGQLLDEGHASLRDDFAASTRQVESVRDALRTQPGVAGVRLSGAGFGGCVVVAHDPGVVLDVGARWSSRLRGGAAAAVSAAP